MSVRQQQHSCSHLFWINNPDISYVLMLLDFETFKAVYFHSYITLNEQSASNSHTFFSFTKKLPKGSVPVPTVKIRPIKKGLELVLKVSCSLILSALKEINGTSSNTLCTHHRYLHMKVCKK